MYHQLGKSTLKAREREVGPQIEKLAKESCLESLESERNLRKEESEKENVEIRASYDMGWQKRGKAHNSLTGVGSMVGLKTGNVVRYGSRSKRCATCEAANIQSKKPCIHDCRLNWDGSSKAMESDVCIDLVKSCGAKNAVVSVLVGDDDSSTTSKVRQNVEHEVEKWSDVVHAKRPFGSSLYSIKTQNKSLTDMVIRYFQRCFGYALKKNKDNEEGVRNGLKSIVPHAYSDHSSCANWCGYLKNPASYKHRGLPHGKDLTDKSLRQSLEKTVEVYASNAKKLHVALLGSSQANETLKNIIKSKAPKIRHYGSSESNDFRVACAVGQKNLGHSYVSQFAKKMDKRILSLKEKQKTREYKTRRIEKKRELFEKDKTP
ncbi:uncharacterized protein [Montipora capricornis]|uniref:uncharacterized protein n=1 Tax=Montipora capricornis TaxID=246305 RepID=UPI0035F11BB8